jgi:propionyl-CoA carboxylase alpha chain
VVTFDVPGVTAHFERPALDGLRLDAGVTDGNVIGTHYDAMMAKVIAYASSREAAARQLAAALRRTRVHGVTTNREVLIGSLLHPAFLAGIADTGFYAAHPPASLVAGMGVPPDLAALVAALSDSARSGGPLASGFRNVPVGFRARTYAVDGAGSAGFSGPADAGGALGAAGAAGPADAVGPVGVLGGAREIRVGYRFGRDGLEVETALAGVSTIALVSASTDRVVLDVDGVRRSWVVGRFDDRVVVDGPRGSAELRRVPRFTDPSALLPAGALVAPMPGTVVRIEVKAGESVVAGQPLVRLEAMKMEQVVNSPVAGTVTELPVSIGQQVSQGTTLAVVTAMTDPASPTVTTSRD